MSSFDQYANGNNHQSNQKFKELAPSPFLSFSVVHILFRRNIKYLRFYSNEWMICATLVCFAYLALAFSPFFHFFAVAACSTMLIIFSDIFSLLLISFPFHFRTNHCFAVTCLFSSFIVLCLSIPLPVNGPAL